MSPALRRLLFGITVGVVLFFAGESCTPAPCFGFSIDSEGFSKEDRASIEEGFERTNTFLGYNRFTLSTDGCPIVRHNYPLDDAGVPIHNGTYRKWHRIMYIGVAQVAGDYMTKVVMHELGHAAGMEHLAKGLEGIMVAQSIDAEDWTWADRVECERSHACPEY